jgi:hypothetical protein
MHTPYIFCFVFVESYWLRTSVKINFGVRFRTKRQRIRIFQHLRGIEIIQIDNAINLAENMNVCSSTIG